MFDLTAARRALPAISTASLATLAFAGAAATVAFDVFGQAISPMTGNATLAPVGLARGVLGTVGLPNGRPEGELLHYATGMVAYPLGWWLVARPVWQAVAPRLHWVGAAAAYGDVLWAFALYVMAHLVAGNAPFLGFTNITWVALAGHVVFGLVAAWVIEARHRLPAPARRAAEAA